MTHVRTLLTHSSKIFTALVAAALIFTWTTQAQGATGSDRPANKVAASGSTTEVAPAGQEIILLEETIKVSNPTDLIIGVDLECSILTNVTTTGDGTSGAQGKADIRVTIDGFPVPVSMDDQGGADTDDPTLPIGTGSDADEVGEVTFCNRVYQRQTTGFSDSGEQNNTIATYFRTKSSHGFTWLALDPSRFMDAGDDNILNVKVLGKLDTAVVSSSADDPARAEVVVGNRTVIIEPVKAAVGEAVTAVDEGS